VRCGGCSVRKAPLPASEAFDSRIGSTRREISSKRFAPGGAKTPILMKTIASRLEYFAQHQPQAIFCRFLSGKTAETITFAQLYERSLAYAAYFTDRGVVRGDVVLIILKHTPHLFYSQLGAILAGAIPSFMPFPSPKQRVDLYWSDHEALFNRINPTLLLTYEEARQAAQAMLSDFSTPILLASDQVLQHKPHPSARIALDADEVACLQHSSGTTNLKKGVMLTHRAIIDQVMAYSSALSFQPDDSIASWLPLYHDMGFIACFMASVIQGTTLVALDPFEWVMRPHLLLDAIQEHKTTFCWLPNFAFSHLVNAARPDASWDLSSMKAFVSCSEPSKSTTFEKFLARFAECGVTRRHLQVCYALAENVFAATQTRLDLPVRTMLFDAEAFAKNNLAQPSPGRAALSVLSCGLPIAGVSLEVRDPSGTVLSDGIMGEIYIHSPFLFAGYYRLPEQTREKLRDGWYATGDIGFIDDGELFVAGRIDDMLIINGSNYYAHEIETIVNSVPAVIPGRNVAIAVDDPYTDTKVVAVLAECRHDADFERIGQDVRRSVLERLGLAVHSVVPLARGELLKTTSGKISRKTNAQFYHDRVLNTDAANVG